MRSEVKSGQAAKLILPGDRFLKYFGKNWNKHRKRRVTREITIFFRGSISSEVANARQ
jgi:hypothetical protein